MTAINKKLQSPLARARGLGSSHEGAHHWLAERVTALAILPLVVWVVYSLFYLRGRTYEEFTAWVAQPWNATLLLLFIIGVYWHAVTGLQVVIEDYTTSHAKKLLLIIAVKLGFTVLGVASLISVLKIAL